MGNEASSHPVITQVNGQQSSPLTWVLWSRISVAVEHSGGGAMARGYIINEQRNVSCVCIVCVYSISVKIIMGRSNSRVWRGQLRVSGARQHAKQRTALNLKEEMGMWQCSYAKIPLNYGTGISGRTFFNLVSVKKCLVTYPCTQVLIC